MRRHLRKYLPDHATIHSHPWLAPLGARFSDRMLHPRLWHLNRHSVAGAVAAGLFCGLLPAPFQMFSAAVCALVFKVNLPLAVLVTLYTNPLTFVPLYILAFGLGQLALELVGAESSVRFVAPPEYGAQGLLAWIDALLAWMMHLGKPLVLGVLLLASLLAFAGYFAVRFAWRFWLVRAWRRRAAQRRQGHL